MEKKDSNIFNYSTPAKIQLNLAKEENETKSMSFSGVACVAGSLAKTWWGGVMFALTAFDNCLTDFIEKGFFLDWTHWKDGRTPVAYVNDAKMQNYALIVDGQFHNNEQSRTTYSVVEERVTNKKYVGMSIGADSKGGRFTDGPTLLSYLEDNNTDLTFYDVDSFKDFKEEIYFATEVTKLEHVTLTITPVFEKTAVRLSNDETICIVADESVRFNEHDYHALRSKILRARGE